MTEIFPLVFANDEVRLLTAVVLGFLFGFSLERGGFGNARKLAGQFYLHDMTVFKVMFTAILVAMVGLYTLVGIGWVDMARMWVNPTFMWAQVVGGFLLGIGFIMSGLCPGTSVVSAASGRWDGLVTVAGIFAGTAVFAVAIDVFPALEALYSAGDMGVSILPEVLGLPTLPFVLGIVIVAGTAFVGAEAVERIFTGRRSQVEHTPRPLPIMKFGLAGALGLVLLVGLGLRPAPGAPPAHRVVTAPPVAPLDLAERIVAGDPGLMIVDVRGDAGTRVPGSYPVALDSTAAPILAGAGEDTDVVIVDDDGSLDAIPASWPDRARYRLLEGGWNGWETRVLTPAAPANRTAAEMEGVRYQNGLSAFFSGEGTQAVQVAPPPVIPSSAAGEKPKRGGC